MALTDLNNSKSLKVIHPAHIENKPEQQNWLIKNIWSSSAVGIIGGPPKCCKTWVGLDMAISVASSSKALGRFDVEQPGGALIYLAEDAINSVRCRIDSICLNRQIKIENLNLHIIDSPIIRLDLASDQKRLISTVKQLRPRLLLLDPLVRMHRCDENSASDVSGLLGFIRELQRTFDIAVILVHHSNKKQHLNPGQSLRGSSDLHAFGDSNLYLKRKNDNLFLFVEHRSAPSFGPIMLKLVSDENINSTHLEIVSDNSNNENPSDSDLKNSVISLLKTTNQPVFRNKIRSQLKVNNQKLGDALIALESKGLISRTKTGWIVSASSSNQLSLFR